MRIFLISLLLFSGCEALAKQPETAAEYKTLVLDLLYMSDLINDSLGLQIPSTTELNNIMMQVELAEFESFVDLDATMLKSFQNKVKAIVNRVKLVQSTTKEVEFPGAEPIPECSNVDPLDVEISLAAKTVAEEILAYAKWECEETVLGENSALACLAPEVAVQAVKAAFEFGEFCLGNRGEANVDANLETTRSIGEHLNEFLDETITSRSSQESIDDLQTTVDTVNDSLNEFFPTIQDNTNEALEALSEANQALANIHSQAESLLYRTQINQIEIESIEVITSDIQQRAEEIRNDTQTLISSYQTIQNVLVNLHQQSQAQLKQISEGNIESVLARSPTKAPLLYQLPGSQGGLLEAVREILTQRLLTIEQMGTNVGVARKSLIAGDNAYNQGVYQQAYSHYSTAYQQLLGAGF